MSDPSYVRLVTRLNLSIVADFEYGSGWSIAGLDVKPFPAADEWPQANQFVSAQLLKGFLEPATEAEYKHLQKLNDALSKAASFDAEAGETLNEAAVTEAARKGRRDLLRAQPAEEPPAEDNKATTKAADKAS